MSKTKNIAIDLIEADEHFEYSLELSEEDYTSHMVFDRIVTELTDERY